MVSLLSNLFIHKSFFVINCFMKFFYTSVSPKIKFYLFLKAVCPYSTKSKLLLKEINTKLILAFNYFNSSKSFYIFCDF